MATPLHATGMMVVVPVLVFSDNCHRQDLSLALGWPESPTAVLDSPGDVAIMPTRSKSPAAVSATSSKTIQLLRKRLRQLLHVTLVLAIGLALAATALAIWCLTSLNGSRHRRPVRCCGIPRLQHPRGQERIRLLRAGERGA